MNKGVSKVHLWAVLVKIFVVFIPKKKRAGVKSFLLGFFNVIRVKRRAKSVGKNLMCSNGVIKINKNTVLGNNVGLQNIEILGNGNVTIGDYFHAGRELLIVSGNHNYEGTKIPYDEEILYKDVTIGNYVWIGERVVILPGTKIGDGAIIQAGAIVHGEIPECAIAGGNPAKVFKYRDKEHFYKLKEEGKFY